MHPNIERQKSCCPLGDAAVHDASLKKDIEVDERGVTDAKQLLYSTESLDLILPRRKEEPPVGRLIATMQWCAAKLVLAPEAHPRSCRGRSFITVDCSSAAV